MNFKVGDKVKLKDGLKPYIIYGGLELLKGMTKFKTDTIKLISYGCIYLSNNPYTYTPEMLELAPEQMDIQQIIDRNYSATVKRGLITPETTPLEFNQKIREETRELFESYCSYVREEVEQKFDPKELADIALVCFAMAKHFNIDLLKVMEEKTLYNETRED